MLPPPVSGGPVFSKIMLVGQAPGVKEPVLGKPFAWTAGRTLFGWFEQFCGVSEEEVRAKIYFAAVCRCFPGKTAAGGDRSTPDEIQVFDLDERRDRSVRPTMIIRETRHPVFLPSLDEVVGRIFRFATSARVFDLIPLPHPSGASPWHRSSGLGLLRKAVRRIARHRAMEI
jgi:uracil-DNA glycosylase